METDRALVTRPAWKAVGLPKGGFGSIPTVSAVLLAYAILVQLAALKAAASLGSIPRQDTCLQVDCKYVTMLA